MGTPLHECAFEGRLQAATLLLTKGKVTLPPSLNAMLSAVNEGGFTPLLAAVKHERLEVIQCLLDAKVAIRLELTPPRREHCTPANLTRVSSTLTDAGGP